MDAEGVQQALWGQHIKRFAQGHQAALFQNGHTITGECLVEVVQSNHGGHRQCVDHLQDCQLVLDIQVIGRFVQQQDPRALGQGASDVHALTLAAGEAAPGALAQMRRIDIAQGLMDDVIVRS